jgi:hypothetical protein
MNTCIRNSSKPSKNNTKLSEDYWSYPLHMSGHATTLYDYEIDRVKLLHQVVKEVTGVEVKKKRIGFLE